MDSILALFPDFSPNSPPSPPNVLCAIKYSKEYACAIELFQWLYGMKEYSGRALKLTEFIVTECEGHYTAWSYRRQCIPKALPDLEDEMNWVNAYTRDCPKNYQLWQHRMHIFESLMTLTSTQRTQAELDDVEEELDRNPKNYHAWQYRQWVLKSFKCNHDAEYKFIIKLVLEDPFNNSVFNHLVFLNVNFGDCYTLPQTVLTPILDSGTTNKALQGYLEWIDQK